MIKDEGQVIFADEYFLSCLVHQATGQGKDFESIVIF
jgi:thymidylate kinase